MEYIIYADESISRGARYSNFCGGALVRSTDIDRVRTEIYSLKKELRLSEAKWSKVSKSYLGKYKRLVDLAFQFIAQDVIKMEV